MKRRLAVLLSCALIAFGQRSSPPSSPTAGPWVVDAVAVDASGRPVADLTAGDFEIVQGGRTRTITHFTRFDTRLHAAVTPTPLLPALDLLPDEIRRNLVVVVDDLGLSVEGISAARGALKTFLAKSISPGDRMAILRTSGGSGVLQQLTEDARTLVDAIDGIVYLGGGTSAASAGSAAWITLGYALDGLRDIPGRKVVVLLAANPGAAGPWIHAEREVALTAHAAATVVYVVDPLSKAPGATPAGPSVLESLARDTGGFFGGDFARVVQDEQGYYAIGFLPPEEENSVGLSGGWSPSAPVELRVRRPGVVVRSRAGYISQRPRVEFPVPVDRNTLLTEALRSPFAARDVGARLTAIFSSYPKDGPVVEAILNFDARDLSCIHDLQDNYQCTVQLRLAAYSDDGRTTAPLERGYQLTLRPAEYRSGRDVGLRAAFPIRLPPGPGGWQIRAVAADVTSDRMGSATRYVETPNVPQGVLALSGLTLYIDSPAVAGTPADPRGTPGVRIFKPGQFCTYLYSVFNPLTGPDKRSKLEIQTRLFADGRVVLDGEPDRITFGEPAKGTHSQIGGHLKLDPLMAPGNYLLQVTVRDQLAPAGAPRQASQFIDFQVRQ
jgi:VWFA-related protein